MSYIDDRFSFLDGGSHGGGSDGFSFVTQNEQFSGGENISVKQPSIAPAYDDDATYAVGDMVMYHGDLYECTTEIPVPEAWDLSHWTAVSLASEVVDLKNTHEMDMLKNYGNLLAEIGTFSANPTPALTAIWSNGNMNARITGTPSYQNMFSVYSSLNDGHISDLLDFDKEYNLVFTTNSSKISLLVHIDSSETYYTESTTFVIPSGAEEFEVSVVVAAGTIDGNITIGIPYLKSHAELAADFQNSIVAITNEQIESLFT